eukprot:jgi/Mesvir1/12354/Mv00537-RA.1
MQEAHLPASPSTGPRRLSLNKLLEPIPPPGEANGGAPNQDTATPDAPGVVPVGPRAPDQKNKPPAQGRSRRGSIKMMFQKKGADTVEPIEPAGATPAPAPKPTAWTGTNQVAPANPAMATPPKKKGGCCFG